MLISTKGPKEQDSGQGPDHTRSKHLIKEDDKQIFSKSHQTCNQSSIEYERKITNRVNHANDAKSIRQIREDVTAYR